MEPEFKHDIDLMQRICKRLFSNNMPIVLMKKHNKIRKTLYIKNLDQSNLLQPQKNMIMFNDWINWEYESYFILVIIHEDVLTLRYAWHFSSNSSNS